MLRWLIRHALVAVFPSTERLPGLDRLNTEAAFVEVMAGPPLLRLGLVGATLVFVLTPLWTVYWPLPSFWLPAAVRERHANALADSRLYLLRQSMLMLKTIGGLLWGGHPQVRAALGLPAYGPDPGSFRGDALHPRSPASSPAAGAASSPAAGAP